MQEPAVATLLCSFVRGLRCGCPFGSRRCLPASASEEGVYAAWQQYVRTTSNLGGTTSASVDGSSRQKRIMTFPVGSPFNRCPSSAETFVSFCADPVRSTHGEGDGRPEISQPVQVLHSGENVPLLQAKTVTACLQGGNLKTSGQGQRERPRQQTSLGISLDHDAVLLGANPACTSSSGIDIGARSKWLVHHRLEWHPAHFLPDNSQDPQNFNQILNKARRTRAHDFATGCFEGAEQVSSSWAAFEELPGAASRPELRPCSMQVPHLALFEVTLRALLGTLPNFLRINGSVRRSLADWTCQPK